VVDKATGDILERSVGAKHVWSALDPAAGTVVLVPQAADLAARPCLDDEEVRYLCAKAGEIERLEGTPQDVEWAIARGAPLPGSVFILQHRPETVASAAPAAPSSEKAFDPVQYALRHVFKVPGT
jgi:pyruvate,water dikinase